MLIRVGYEMSFHFKFPTPLILLLHLHPDCAASIVEPETFAALPDVPISHYRDVFDNHCTRLLAPAGLVTFTGNAVVEDAGYPDPTHPTLRQHNVEDLPSECLQFLLASRYCEVDKLSSAAWDLFENTPPGWERVQAICDWVHENILYGHEYASPTKTAYETFTTRTGVCRDFAHIAITLCRCMNIPARYVTGYLQDIVFLPPDTPMDFHAWFEAYLGGQWHRFDARFNTPARGRVVMARGRDAVDVALMTAFGSHTLEKFVVWTDEIDADGKIVPLSCPV